MKTNLVITRSGAVQIHYYRQPQETWVTPWIGVDHLASQPDLPTLPEWKDRQVDGYAFFLDHELKLLSSPLWTTIGGEQLTGAEPFDLCGQEWDYPSDWASQSYPMDECLYTEIMNALYNMLDTIEPEPEPEGNDAIDMGFSIVRTEEWGCNGRRVKIARCCNVEFALDGMTNECEVCGRAYNWAGQELAPPEQWDPEDRYACFGPQHVREDY